MLSLKTIGTRENETAIMLRGKGVTVQGLMARETTLIEQLYLMPIAPIGKDPSKGNLAPEVPLYDDPAYQVAMISCISRRIKTEAAIGLDWKTADGRQWADICEDNTAALAWCDEAGRELVAATMSEPEIESVLEAMTRIQGGGLKDKEVPG